MMRIGRSFEINPREPSFSDHDFHRVCTLIRARAGIALGADKRNMVYGRLSRRLKRLRIGSFRTYLDALEGDCEGEEWQGFINALTTNLTSFFRESHHFKTLREHLTARPAKQHPLRLWSCAASSGEEAWSMAITACEAFHTLTPPVRILASDIDTQVLETARRGVYPLERIESLDAELKRRYFQRGSGPNAGYCRVIPALRVLVDFRPLNLLAPRHDIGGPFAAVFCRNVMIYFDKKTQREVLSRIILTMDRDSLLYTGHAENYLHAADLILPHGRSLYRRNLERT